MLPAAAQEGGLDFREHLSPRSREGHTELSLGATLETHARAHTHTHWQSVLRKDDSKRQRNMAVKRVNFTRRRNPRRAQLLL